MTGHRCERPGCKNDRAEVSRINGVIRLKQETTKSLASWRNASYPAFTPLVVGYI